MASRPVYYDLYDCGRLDGRYRAAELMVMLGIRHRQQIEHYSDIGILYQGRYRIVRVDVGPRRTWEEEWDWVCERLRSSGYDLGRIRIRISRDV